MQNCVGVADFRGQEQTRLILSLVRFVNIEILSFVSIHLFYMIILLWSSLSCLNHTPKLALLHSLLLVHTYL